MGDVHFLEKIVIVHIMDTHTISFQTVGQFASASGFHTTIIHVIKTTIGSSDSMKLAYQTQTKQYNDQSHLVCVEHGFVVNKMHTLIKKTVHKKFDLKE